MKSIVLALIALALSASTAQAQQVKVLVFHGPPDATNTAGTTAIKELGTANSFAVDDTASATDISDANLANYRAVVFLNTSGDLLNADQEAALTRYVQAGNGFLGIGSAAAGETGNTFFDGLIGARPAAGSPTTAATMAVEAGDRVHPSTRDLPLTFQRSDIWYQWQTRPTGSVHTVARYRAPTAAPGDGTDIGGTDTPISWCRDYRGGRSFYTGMGRVADAYAEQNFRKHLLGALQWTAGLSRTNCKATINANYKATQIMSAGPESTGLATSGESHGIAVANNGWVLYIGRGDCRTDAERGALLGGAPLGRTLDFANPNAGIGCGSVHIWDPKQANGTVNSGITRAGTLAVYGDGGQGGERSDEADQKLEWGLIGIAPSPDFATTGHVYLQYYPSFNPASVPPGLPVANRITKMSQPRISRFTINLATKQLDLASEVRIFQYDAQVYSCCHTGGGMGFDSAGDLYVTTGDDNSSQGSNGYSGNNPTAHCPTGPTDQPSNANCGDNAISFQDARRTAGNTNNYNGKMLRFRPKPDIPEGTQPPIGPGSTYDIPGATAPNGPNLFDGNEGGGGKAKPEIFAMGLRNPSRLSIDPKTDTVYTAWVGPDAGQPSRTEGPSTYENAAQITQAGNYGWPYCMGSNQAYRDRTADGNLRTTNAAGYVSGGPATGGTDGWYDCDNIHNDSPNNTGLVEFPHQTGTGMDAGKVRAKNLWYSRGNPGNNNGCPEFDRPRGANFAPDYGSTPKSLCPYAQDNGMTIMDGPVYRYDATAADQSRRWPAYWDGRWFLHNNGGPSIKHGLLLDPATDQDGGQPVYADSLRNTLSWQGSYMDSKFGPDGALYVQTYDGFFRAGPAVGIYRYDYVGGPSTPVAAPKAVPIGNRQVRFSIGSSGGVAYKWEFGDGTESTDPNPVHTYPEAKHYTAKLTVTYADGDPSVGTVEVDVLEQPDTTAPVTTAAFDPAQPGNGGTYQRPVTVTLAATDAAGGSGVDFTEYRVNSSGDFAPYEGPITRSEPGDYKVEFRSVDKTGNVEATKSVSFTIAVLQNCPSNLNDEFSGTSLDPKWQVLRPDPAARSFVDGRLKLLVRAGDMIGTQADAKNVLLQPAPDTSWRIQTKFDVSTLTVEGQQAGFVLWNSENPNTFAKITYISKGSFSQFEWVATRANNSDIHSGPQLATVPKEVYLRISANGSGTYIAEGSVDGENWQQISDPITGIGDPKTLKFGLKISNNASSDTNYALFDYFRVDCSDKVAPTTTAVVTPDKPDGELGWYKTPPTVTLDADDGALGEVDKIQYKLDAGALTTYGAPIKVTGDGEHTLEFFATDKAGNVEAVKKTAFRVDASAPVTEATMAGDGPVSVTLNARDSGSGAVLTQYRVDGGPWTAYASKDEQLLDDSAASLAQWIQAPLGHFERMTDGSGGITPVDGLGMLWYPKPYGDFRLKLQFREGRTDNGFSNGGVFVRFPDPRGEPRNQCENYGSAPTDDAWVAIYCGFEIQLFDGPGNGEPRKTGSVYTFKNNDGDHIGKPKPRGEWEDYEIEVRGMHYKIFRNGDLINEFENAPGISPDPARAGDPSTSLRQFTRGYIGLQNHSLDDKMQYRNVRVEDLTPGAPGLNATGPFTVAGVGPHTVEVRSVDAAGNAEAKRTFDVEIGSSTPPTIAPSTPSTGALMPPMITTPKRFTVGKLSSRMSAKSFARRGISVPVTCTGALTGSAKATVASSTRKRLHLAKATLDTGDVQCYGPHTATVRLKPSSSVARRLTARGGPKSVKVTLSIQMRDFGKAPTTIKKTLTITR